MPGYTTGRRRPKKLKGSEAQEAGGYVWVWILKRLIPALIIILLVLKALQCLHLIL